MLPEGKESKSCFTRPATVRHSTRWAKVTAGLEAPESSGDNNKELPIPRDAVPLKELQCSQVRWDGLTRFFGHWFKSEKAVDIKSLDGSKSVAISTLTANAGSLIQVKARSIKVCSIGKPRARVGTQHQVSFHSGGPTFSPSPSPCLSCICSPLLLFTMTSSGYDTVVRSTKLFGALSISSFMQII